MRKWKEKAAIGGFVALTCLAVVCVTARMPGLSAEDTALATAGFILPRGAAEAIRTGYTGDDELPEESVQPEIPSSAPSSSLPSSGSVSSQEGDSSGKAVVKSLEPTVEGNYKEMTIANSGTQYENIWVKNTNKNNSIDIAEELKKQPAVKIEKNGKPMVLIYHTHTTEAYQGLTRSQDNTQNMVAVGDIIERKLKDAGIGVVHDTTCHDYPAYNGSYDRSGETIQKNLKKYPTIQVTLDIHRDAMTQSDGTIIKPTVEVNGKKAAQIMIISGCDDDGTLGFPNWQYNLRLAVRMQKSIADRYGALARPLNFCPRKYNEHMTKGSLLVEIGTHGNTLEESKYAAELFGDALVDTLNQLM